MNNFLGKDNYVWWVGVVENINDPLQLGRCQVRIFGWHSENKNDIPTEDLPWAQASFSPSSSNKWSVPNYGEYVTGFFGDGLSAQMPIMTGVMPGIYRSANADTGSSGNKGFQDGRTPEQKATGPQMPAGQVRYVDGQPTTPPLARGIVANTAIYQQNNNVSHTCDFITDLLKNQALKQFLDASGQAIRNGIRAIMQALGLGDPSGTLTALTSMLKQAARTLKFIQTQIQVIVDFEKYVLGYIAQIQQIIQWILSLPAQLQALLAECLYKLLQGIKNVFSDVFSSVNPFGEFGELVSAVHEVGNAAQGVAQTAVTAVAGAQAVVIATKTTIQEAQQITQLPAQFATVIKNTSQIATVATVATITSSIKSVGSSFPTASSATSSAQSSSQNKDTP